MPLKNLLSIHDSGGFWGALQRRALLGRFFSFSPQQWNRNKENDGRMINGRWLWCIVNVRIFAWVCVCVCAMNRFDSEWWSIHAVIATLSHQWNDFDERGEKNNNGEWKTEWMCVYSIQFFFFVCYVMNEPQIKYGTLEKQKPTINAYNL